MPRTPAKWVLVRTGWGLALLCVPRQVLRLAGHPQPARAAAVVTRILGARHLVQAATMLAKPSRRTIWAGAVADSLHALTGVAVAAVSPCWRAAAASDALVAATFAFLGGTQDRSRSEQA
jgi:hypothetical protein